MSWLITLQLAS